ncbi:MULTISPECIES: cation-transporting P-type ATPase [Clostridium]|uniref:P-type ATPase n=1 Tax=Clostridium TaxID=1485 RepID=UPI0008263ED2|nr:MULTISPECIES: cation-transporting P-type ATPase [Clostridium]PJI07097.1 cation transporter [Clostridium sp. CT7]
MSDWYGLAAVDIVNLFRSNDIRGLSDEEVINNRKAYGSNKIVSSKNKTLTLNMLRQIVNPWFIFFMFCAVTLAYAGRIEYCIVVLAMDIAALIVSLIPNYMMYKSIKNVESFNSRKVNVLRNAKLTSINAEDLVVGDIIAFSKGNVIPGDVRIIDARDLKINEVNVTGDESIIEKFSAKIYGDDLEISEMRNMLFKSSIVCEGEGEGIVIAVGDKTEFGKTMATTLDIDKSSNFLLENVKKVMNALAIFSFAAWIVVMCYMSSSNVALNSSIDAASIVIFSGASVNVIFVLYAIFLIINLHFKSKHIKLKSLSNIENLSKINAIVTDKEEALTKNKMYVRKFYDNESVRNCDNKFQVNSNIKRMLEIGFMCNDYGSKKNSNATLNDAEGAILEFIEKEEMELEPSKRIFEISYNRNKRIKTTVNKIKRRYRANVKGPVDTILKNCTHYMIDGVERELTNEVINNIKLADMKMSNECLHVMALAYRNFSYNPSPDENIESNLVFVGLMGFESIFKSNAKIAVERCIANSIKPIIFTEDGKLTAAAMAKNLNIYSGANCVLAGVEMDNMSQEEIKNSVDNITIYSRASEENKRDVVLDLKELNYNVLTSGSKLTELKSINESNLSISYGEKCNKIVEKLSDVAFGENDMWSIVNIIVDSRKFVIAFKDMVKYILTWNFNLVILFLIFMLKGISLKFNAFEILWVLFFSITVNSAAVFLNYKKVISQYDFNLEEDNLLDISLFSILFNGVLPAILVLGSCIVFSDVNIQTFVFWCVIFQQIVYGLFNRFEKNIWFLVVITLNLILQLGIALSNFGNYMFGINNLSYYEIKIIGVVLGLQVFVIFGKKLFTE